MKALSPIFSKNEMLFCSIPVPPIQDHKGGEFDFTEAQVAAYGQSQTHPSIIYVPGGWNGHEYWLAATPYPRAVGVFENPCIYYGDADDAGNPPRVFTPISGTPSEDYSMVNNPIVKVPNNNTTNSDPDLWLDPDTGLMWMVSRENSNNHAPYSQKSSDGQAWTPRGPRSSFLWKEGVGDLVGKPEFVSPAIVRVGDKIRIYSLSGSAGIYSLNYDLNNGLCWGLWVMEGTSLEGRGDFAYKKKAAILGKRGIEPWHMDMFVDQRTGYIYMICSATNYLTGTTDVYLAESQDGWDFHLFSKPILAGGYSHYRPSAALRPSDNVLAVYFSVVNAPLTPASYPNGASDVPVDGRAIGVASKNFDDILSELKESEVLGWIE